MSTPPKMDVWVLAGQSNMQGCGLLNEPTLSPASSSDERVWAFTSAGNWEIAEEPLHNLWESFTPVHQNFMRAGFNEEANAVSDEEYARQCRENPIGGSGLGIAFGVAMADATGNPIGLIPAAHGGTSLGQWNSDLKDEGGNSLYGAMLERIRKASETADFELKGVLWYQGESDCDPTNSVTYGERYAAWIEALRKDLDMPNLPVYSVQLGRLIQPITLKPGEGWDINSWDHVREALRTMPERTSNTATVSAIDLGLADAIHIDTDGLIRLGKRMARLALSGGEGPSLVKLEQGANSTNGHVIVRVICEGVTGGWNPKNRIPGFETRDAEGKSHQSILVIEANADVHDPKVINVWLNGIADDVQLGYGLGLNPPCILVDDADMPLSAFMPQPIVKA